MSFNLIKFRSGLMEHCIYRLLLKNIPSEEFMDTKICFPKYKLNNSQERLKVYNT